MHVESWPDAGLPRQRLSCQNCLDSVLAAEIVWTGSDGARIIVIEGVPCGQWMVLREP